MRSCLYDCQVTHQRLSPKKHALNYHVFMFYLDLEELETLPKKLWIFSRNRFNFFSFYDRDHLLFGQKNVKAALLHFLNQRGVFLQNPQIQFLTYVRTLGYVFNPVSFYFCSQDGKAVCSVAEVGNTFGEKKYFLLDSSCKTAEDFFKLRVQKNFYVSPFMRPDIEFEFGLKVPSEALSVYVNDYDQSQLLLLANLKGKKVPLSNWNLIKYGITFPWISVKVITMIHLNALWLYLKKIPFWRKQENVQHQKDMFKL